MSTAQPTSTVAPGPAVDLASRYADQLVGQLRCYDRVLVHGLLPDVAHPAALAVTMHAAGFAPKDLARFAQPLRTQVCDQAVLLARQYDVPIEFVRKRNFRKEDRIAQILQSRGTQPGLIHIFAAKENGTVFDTRKNGPNGHVKLIARPGCCLHYYFYWMHEELGLIYVRVPTWLPLRVQIYFNGHSWLAVQLRRAGIAHEMADNALSQCADWTAAQALADSLRARALRTLFDALARLCCPASTCFKSGYHWSFVQVEYAQDLIFRDSASVDRLFDGLARQALLEVRADDVARFLGRRLPWSHDTRVDSHLGRRHQGLRLKHAYGPASVKLYNKPGGILRLEVTTYDVTFFKHYREVVHQDGSKENKVAAMKKSLYSLRQLTELLRAALGRYSQWLAALVQPEAGASKLEQLGEAKRDEQGRSHRGLNLFAGEDLQMIETVLRGEHGLLGLTARRIKTLLGHWSAGRVSRLLRRLRVHGLLKKIARSYTYYVTEYGRRVLLAALHVRRQILTPPMPLTA